MQGTFICPICDGSKIIQGNDPKLLKPTNIITTCKLCETQFRLTFSLKKQQLFNELWVLHLPQIAIELLLEEPKRLRQIINPYVARTFLQNFSSNGQKVGFLVNKGKETPLHEASDAQCMAAASALSQLKNQRDIIQPIPTTADDCANNA